jgi:hypothetical protein
MGPKRIKQVTVDAPSINCQDNRRYSSSLPLVNNGKSTDANDRKDPQGGSNIDGNGHKCLVNLIDHNGLLASSQQLGHEDHCAYRQSHKAYHSRNENGTRLKKVALTNTLGRLREITLPKTIDSKDLLNNACKQLLH